MKNHSQKPKIFLKIKVILLHCKHRVTQLIPWQQPRDFRNNKQVISAETTQVQEFNVPKM